jgi:hypothetical protein
VQIAVSATNVLCDVRAMRYVAVDACTVAAPPTVASGDAASIAIERLPLTSVPDTDGSAGAELGDVGLLPHACNAAPSVSSDAA